MVLFQEALGEEDQTQQARKKERSVAGQSMALRKPCCLGFRVVAKNTRDRISTDF